MIASIVRDTDSLTLMLFQLLESFQGQQTRPLYEYSGRKNENNSKPYHPDTKINIAFGVVSHLFLFMIQPVIFLISFIELVLIHLNFVDDDDHCVDENRDYHSIQIEDLD